MIASAINTKPHAGAHRSRTSRFATSHQAKILVPEYYLEYKTILENVREARECRAFPRGFLGLVATFEQRGPQWLSLGLIRNDYAENALDWA